MTDASDVQVAVEAALGKAGEVVSAWVLVFEAVEEDGSVTLRHEVSPDMTNWMRTGMLYAAIDMAGLIYEDE